jgi:hypothetical protein
MAAAVVVMLRTPLSLAIPGSRPGHRLIGLWVRRRVGWGC